MAASNQARPAGNYNNLGADYLSPVSSGADIGILDASDGDEYARFDSSASSFLVDVVDEFTSGAGVIIGGVRLGSNTVRLPNNTEMLGRNAADSANIGIVKIDTSNQVIFGSAANTTATRSSLGLGTLSTQAASSVAITGGSIVDTAITSSTHVNIGDDTNYMGRIYASGFHWVSRPTWSASSFSTTRSVSGGSSLSTLAAAFCTLIDDLQSARMLGTP